ncbi:hypothetical protein ACFQS7_26085 [Dankookia sp. GCM10030260]|uniref:hypothetical protein n=1 Tax=Dankookia sp. GCM10030260 TaxID=3273390 RepID=UPI00361E919C
MGGAVRGASGFVQAAKLMLAARTANTKRFDIVSLGVLTLAELRTATVAGLAAPQESVD